MPRKKPPFWRQPFLFSLNPGQSPEPPKSSSSTSTSKSYPTEGEPHALQNDRPATPGGPDGAVRTVEKHPDAALHDGKPGDGAQKPAPDVAGNADQGAARQRPDADQERSNGTGAQEPGGLFALRVTAERGPRAFDRRGNGLHRESHVARLNRSRGQRSLFDQPPAHQAHDDPPPPPQAGGIAIAEPPRQTAPADSTSSQPFSDAPPPAPGVDIASGEKAKARDIITAIRTLKTIEREGRPATCDEQSVLCRFAGFGSVALGLFPDPVTGRYKDQGWQALGEELKSLLTDEEYASAKRTTFNAFYTSPLVAKTIYKALHRFGIPQTATVLEPGCGVGNFLGMAPLGMRFIGVEMDSLSGRIARAIHPEADIRIENFRDTKLPENRIDAVVGNVPFADVKIEYAGQKLALHDFFFCKSIDALKPGGVLAVVTSHFTLDKQNSAVREYLGERADFLGAIRLPSDAFRREGTQVVTDIVFLRKRLPGEHARHQEAEWNRSRPIEIDGEEIPINRYFVRHPEMVLGKWSRKNRLYADGYSVASNGDLVKQLDEAVRRLPENVASVSASAPEP
ncbi:MAG TPA: hypothetical protein VFW87_00665, partial [Pirellulales bacterium]|nr:hypothetical protein [Pirellulales bacterium]